MAFRVSSSLWLLLLVLGLLQYWVHGEPQVPCYFIFGDSLVDNGNNNFLLTLARPNYSPYGIDFPKGSTGRFTNGRTMTDVIGELLGFDNYTPSFAAARGNDILKGVNYASGGGGILDETGRNLGDRVSLNGQLQNHQTTVNTIVGILGSNNNASVNHLSKCIYAMIIGNNDYINNYYLPNDYETSNLYNPQQYAQLLTRQYAQQLKTLYSYNARKIVLFGLSALGCTPAEMALYGTGGSSGCVENINNAAQLFNAELKSLVDELNKNLADAKFIYVNSYDISAASITSPGFIVKIAPCCNVGIGTLCIPFLIPCKNRSEYAFWDAFHPTDALNVVIAGRAYRAQSPTDTYPYDISRLAQL